ncbi:transposase [Leucothrix sargassi]|nr:transposase [Leucothrix sargassi]
MELNKNHDIYRLEAAVDWVYLVEAVAKLLDVSDHEKCRLMVGLIYLKVMYGLSTQEVYTKWLECPYWRHFCGLEVSEATNEALPFVPAVLEIWERELAGAGNNMLICALLKRNLIK